MSRIVSVLSEVKVTGREVDGLGERREGLDRLEQDVDRHLGADRERQLAQPLAGLRADGDRAHQNTAVGVGDS